MTPPGDLPLEQLERAGARMLAFIRDYLEHPGRYPVLARVAPGELRAALPASPPVDPEPLERIQDDFERLIPPALSHWNHPGFLAYFANTGSVPGMLGELATAAFNVNGMLWRTSPAATELEEVVLDWLRQALGLPAGLFGMITDTASISTLLALAAARDQAVPALRQQGFRAVTAPLRLYASEQAHSSVDKAAIMLGIGLDHVVPVPTDAALRMDPAALAELIARDRAASMQPFAVVATAGTTSSTSVDPVPAIAGICEREGLWLHVDAAYGGAAAIAPELAWVLAGAEQADSLVVNPHKWLFTPMDCSCLWTRKPEALRQAFRLVPEYLQSNNADAVNYMDYGIQLGRRFRALKLWFVLRAYGTRGLAERIREHVRIAGTLARAIAAEPTLELMAEAPLSVVCFRVRPADPASDGEAADRRNLAILELVNASGEVLLSSTRLRGRLVLRIAIGNIRTAESHAERALALVLRAAADVGGS